MNRHNNSASRNQSPPAAPAARAKNQAAEDAKKALLVQVRSAVKAGSIPGVDPVC